MMVNEGVGSGRKGWRAGRENRKDRMSSEG